MTEIDQGATRRQALRFLGSGVALAALATTVLEDRTLAADATPAAGESMEGLYVVTRTRQVKPEKTAADLDNLTTHIREGLVPILRQIPGFVEYFIIWNETARERTAINIFRDKAGTDESTKQASAYLTANNLNDFYVDATPVITEGSIILFAVGDG